jgi:hypothetical protein
MVKFFVENCICEEINKKFNFYLQLHKDNFYELLSFEQKNIFFDI